MSINANKKNQTTKMGKLLIINITSITEGSNIFKNLKSCYKQVFKNLVISLRKWGEDINW